ncbi:MAG: hypothetical protein KAW92_10555 [Candidatus Cloacimonetes bacterium]|nr:hypothetical protein [Candidatus Cloacimonadota bacterium]
MICPVCKQRWAPNEWFGETVPDRVRERLFRNNKVRCCCTSECLEVVDAMEAQYIEFGTGMIYDNLVEETKRELEEGKIK